MISSAIQKGSTVYVYGEKNNILFTKSGTLHGYIGNSVSVRRGNVIFTYNERGSQISAHSAK